MHHWPLGKLTEAATAFYRRPPDEKRIKRLGFTLADYQTKDVQVWPENWPSWALFQSLCTQWRSGPGGAIGLDYTVVQQRLQAIHPDDLDSMFGDVQAMELAALAEMTKAQEDD